MDVITHPCLTISLFVSGANWMVRKMSSKSNPKVEIAIDGDNINIRVITKVMTREESFTVGTPYEQKQMDDTMSLVREISFFNATKWTPLQQQRGSNSFHLTHKPLSKHASYHQCTGRSCCLATNINMSKAGDPVGIRFSAESSDAFIVNVITYPC